MARGHFVGRTPWSGLVSATKVRDELTPEHGNNLTETTLPQVTPPSWVVPPPTPPRDAAPSMFE